MARKSVFSLVLVSVILWVKALPVFGQPSLQGEWVNPQPPDGGQLLVNAPGHANCAPPGYYMLFVIDDLGVPSVARWIQLLPSPCPADLNEDNLHFSSRFA